MPERKQGQAQEGSLVKRLSGFSITELVVVLVMISIFVTTAKPLYMQFKVYAHRGEAKSNLGHIKTLQSAYHVDYAAYSSLPMVGYAGSGASVCAGSAFDNVLGFQPQDCAQLRYGYSANVNGQTFEALAYARSDSEQKWIYAGCEGRGAIQFGRDRGDLLRTKNDKGIEVCRNITKHCPESGRTGSAASDCGTPLIDDGSTPQNPNLITGVTEIPFDPLTPVIPLEEREVVCKASIGAGFPMGILGSYSNSYGYNVICPTTDEHGDDLTCLECPRTGVTVACNVGCGSAEMRYCYDSVSQKNTKCDCSSNPCVEEAHVAYCNTIQDPKEGKCFHMITMTSIVGVYGSPVGVSASGFCHKLDGNIVSPCPP